MNPEVRWDPELDSRYKSIILNILIWTLRFGETLKLTNVKIQLHWIFYMDPKVGWDPELDSRYKLIILNALAWTLRLGETLNLTHVTLRMVETLNLTHLIVLDI